MFGDLVRVGIIIFWLIILERSYNIPTNAFNSGFLTYSAGSSLILVIYLIIKAIYIKTYIKRYHYDCTENFITIKKHVFTPTEIHVQYQKIQDVYVDQDLLDRMMGLYDVHIASATATSGIEAHIDGVDQQAAEGIKNFLLDKIKVGGMPPAGGSAAVSPIQNLQAPISPQVKFDRPITSNEYPIQGKWLVSAAISSLFSALFFLLVPFLLFLQDETTSPHILSKIGSYSAAIYFFTYCASAIFLFIWRVLWKNNYWFEFTPEYILLRDGVISKEERHLPYKSIQNVTLNQGVVARMLGIGSVSIENAASQGYGRGVVIPGQSIEKANELLAILNSIISKNANPAGMGL